MFDVRLYFLCLFLTLTSCCCHPIPPQHAFYTGPTDPMDVVIAGINHNSARIPTLWTQLNYTATLVDPQKHTTDIAGDGSLLFARPICLRLVGTKDIAGEVFQLGSNGNEFWVKIRSGSDTYNFWWGHFANLGKPCCKPIPIRPDMIVQVLGVGLYQPDFLEQPVPVMRFDNEHDVYIFDRNIRQADRWETQQEIWYDRATRLPTRVLLYGSDGRVALKADLSDHTPVELADVPQDQWPKIARHYDLSFPDSGTKITFDFLNPALQHTLKRMTTPNPASFTFTPPTDQNTHVIQIDADCNDTAAMAR